MGIRILFAVSVLLVTQFAFAESTLDIENSDSAYIIQMQNEIFRLQREGLEYKLSCREQIVKTFSDENWIGFFMVLADEDMGITIPVNYAEKYTV